jgi:8-oxo-dGTP pyrophosphatase MutT (NUDIX family)
LAASEDLIGRIQSRLLRRPDEAAAVSDLKPDWQPEVPFSRPPIPAAVLIGIVARESGLSVLYTERSPDLRAHSGQIAFPGGKIDAGDMDAADAALREAREEIDLEPADAHVLGFMPQYYTGSNYLITPVVAVVRPSKPFLPNPSEVRSVFEVPLDWLMDIGNYGTFTLTRNGYEHTTPQIRHGEWTIWGITANLTRRFHDMALSRETVS